MHPCKFNTFYNDEIFRLTFISVYGLVSHDLDNKNEWKTCLQVKGVTLPTGYFFGASAITGKIKFVLYDLRIQARHKFRENQRPA